MIDGEDRCLDGNSVLADLSGRSDSDFSERLVEPPRTLDSRDGYAVASNRVQVRPFDNNGKISRHLAFDDKPIGCLETAVRRELPSNQFVTKLDSTVPGVAVHPVLLKGELRCLVEISVLLCLTVGRNVNIV